MRQKEEGKLYVAKFYDKSLYSSVRESSILKSLKHSGLPAFSDEFQDDRIICIVREYISGRTLNQYKFENNLTKKDVIKICIQLCDILIYLHECKNPVIHRDIKPQNIIVKNDGTISLIDFDISRIYNVDVKTDTQFIGTRECSSGAIWLFTDRLSYRHLFGGGGVRMAFNRGNRFKRSDTVIRR